MAKIIEHNFSGKAGRDLLTSSFGSFMQEIEDKKFLLGEMVTQAREFLSRQKMNPGDFILSESYLREFLVTPLELEEENGEKDRYAEIVYLNRRDKRITAVCQFAVPEDGGVTISYQMYALDDPGRGNGCWKLYNFRSQSWVEDEEDCFDLQMVLREIEKGTAGMM